MVHVVDVVQRRERQREGLVLLEEVVQVRARVGDRLHLRIYWRVVVLIFFSGNPHITLCSKQRPVPSDACRIARVHRVDAQRYDGSTALGVRNSQ